MLYFYSITLIYELVTLQSKIDFIGNMIKKQTNTDYDNQNNSVCQI